MIRRLRIATSYVCLVLSVWLLAWWVDSHRIYLHASVSAPPRHRFSIDQIFGEFLLGWDRGPAAFGADLKYFKNMERMREEWEASLIKPNTVFGFGADYRPTLLRLIVPHWFPVLIIGMLAILLRPKPRWRCGIRELLVITTHVAVVVAGFVLFSQTAQEWPN